MFGLGPIRARPDGAVSRPDRGAGATAGATRRCGILSRRLLALPIFLAGAIWLGWYFVPAGAAAPETATAVQTAQYSCDDGCPGGPPPRSWRNGKPDKNFSIPLETIVWWLLVANVLQAAGLIIMAVRFSSTGPTIDLSKVKLVGTVDKAS